MTLAVSQNSLAQPALQAQANVGGYLPRSIYTPVPFLLPILLTGMSVSML